MRCANISPIVSEAWEEAVSLSAYGTEVGTIGWYHYLAYIKRWNYRTGRTEWRRLPHRDTNTPPKPSHADPFSSRTLLRYFQ